MPTHAALQRDPGLLYDLGKELGMPRIVICGGPDAGKTAMAEELRVVPVWHTDDLNRLDWSDQSWACYRWLCRQGSFVIEGTTAVRAVRKWLKRHSDGLPFDRIYWMERVVVNLSPGQERMRKGCRTIWESIQPELIRRGADLRVIY